MMTTYVLGAGASHHAGFPLCSALWAQMMFWVIDSQPDPAYRQAVDTVVALNGPVTDVEEMFTNLDNGRGVFEALAEGQRTRLKRAIRRCLKDYFKLITHQHLNAPLYATFADKISAGDRIVTFNYDVSLECALIGARRFGVKNGYGSSFVATWDEFDSEITVLKLHGSINWIGSVFGGIQGFGSFVNSLGDRPFVDNSESFLPTYPSRVLDTSFRGGGVANEAPTLILPTYEKKYFVSTSVGDEWSDFYESLWAQAAESLERSERIVMIGYSMPQAGTRARALLLWANNKRAEILLCCSGSNETLKRDFETHGFARVTSLGTFADFCSVAG
jgi:hypothetical protein